MNVQQLVAVFLAAILTENYVLSKFLGICPFLGVSKKVNTAVGMSAAVTFVMVLATAVTYPIYENLLVPNDLAYLQTIVFILVIAGLVQLVEIVLKKYMPSLYNALGIYLPLITTNCAVLGVTMLVLEKASGDPSYTYVSALVNALGAGIGFLVAMVMFAGVRQPAGRVRHTKMYEGPSDYARRGVARFAVVFRLCGTCRRADVTGNERFFKKEGVNRYEPDIVCCARGCGHRAGCRHRAGGGVRRDGGAKGRKGRSGFRGASGRKLRRVRLFRVLGLCKRPWRRAAQSRGCAPPAAKKRQRRFPRYSAHRRKKR